MPDTPRRILSDNEKIYRKYRNPQRECVHVMLECIPSLDIPCIEEALNNLSQSVPELRYSIYNDRFVHTEERLRIRTVRIPNFTGYNFEALAFSGKIDSNLLIEITHIESLGKHWLIFKVSHSLTDGQGVLMILEMLFKTLNGEAIILPNSQENDIEFINRIGHKGRHPKLRYNNTLTYVSHDSHDTDYVRRITLENAISFPLPKIITLLNTYYENQSLIYMIPCDTRRYDPSTINIGNLTVPLYLSCKKTDTWHEIMTRLYEQIKKKEHLSIRVVSYPLLTNLNAVLFNAIISISRSLQLWTHRFLTAGSITTVGTIDLDIYRSSALTVTSIVFVPLFQPLIPLSIEIVEMRNKTEIILVSNYRVIDSKTMDAIMSNIKTLAS